MADLTSTIAGVLRTHVGERREFVIFHSDRARNYYVQCAEVDDDRKELLTEAVSDRWLEPPNMLGPRGASALQGLGWAAPGDESPNWHRVVRIAGDESLDLIAAQLVETLRTVYGLTSDSIEVEIAP